MGAMATLGNDNKDTNRGVTGRVRLSQVWPVSLSH